MRMTFGLHTAEGVRKFRAYMEEAADLCVSYGGSLSGEHGDGQARGELLPKMFGTDVIQAFRDFKTIWDPTWRMNPGKIVDPYPLDSNLRVGPEYKPIQVVTHFTFPEDHHSFADAAERCFGAGKCRELGGRTMCPSFQATREEKYSTRGRARLLFEMMRGEAIADGWRSDAVRDALDMCLQCKGCRHDCPVSVDMATYKAEFLSHYYAGRLRPRAAYTIGLVEMWSETLRPAIRAGVPLVVLEPSCASVFRDEMPNLLAGDRDAERLASQTKTLAELLGETAGWSPPRLAAQALLQSHCHHRAVLNANAQRDLLESMSIELQPLASGCCGHAGSFRYEREHYDVPQTIANQRFCCRPCARPRLTHSSLRTAHGRCGGIAARVSRVLRARGILTIPWLFPGLFRPIIPAVQIGP